MSESHEDVNETLVRTYYDALADFIVDKGGTKELIHDFDDISLWECHLPDKSLATNPEYLNLCVDSLQHVTKNVFLRIRPEIYTVYYEGAIAFAELEEDDLPCVLLSRDEKQLQDAIDEGTTTLITNWPELEDLFKDAKSEDILSVSVILGEGKDEQLYVETYAIDTALLIAKSLSEDN